MRVNVSVDDLVPGTLVVPKEDFVFCEHVSLRPKELHPVTNARISYVWVEHRVGARVAMEFHPDETRVLEDPFEFVGAESWTSKEHVLAVDRVVVRRRKFLAFKTPSGETVHLDRSHVGRRCQIEV